MRSTDEFDAALDADARALLARVRGFAHAEVAPHADDWDERGTFPLDALRRACTQGLAGIELSRAQGGLGLPFAAKPRAAEELARVDFGFAFALINHHNAVARIADKASDAARARFVAPMLAGELIGCTGMTGPEAGSDFSAIAMSARRVAGGWLLDGAKQWITNAAAADVIVTFAQCEPGTRHRGIGCFIVDAREPGFARDAPARLPGLAAAGIGGFVLREHFVPDALLLYPPGQAFGEAMRSVNKARTYVAAMCAGMIDGALARALHHGREPARVRPAAGRAPGAALVARRGRGDARGAAAARLPVDGADRARRGRATGRGDRQEVRRRPRADGDRALRAGDGRVRAVARGRADAAHGGGQGSGVRRRHHRDDERADRRAAGQGLSPPARGPAASRKGD